jgi:hypothetical protein
MRGKTPFGLTSASIPTPPLATSGTKPASTNSCRKAVSAGSMIVSTQSINRVPVQSCMRWARSCAAPQRVEKSSMSRRTAADAWGCGSQRKSVKGLCFVKDMVHPVSEAEKKRPPIRNRADRPKQRKLRPRRNQSQQQTARLTDIKQVSIGPALQLSAGV